MSVVSDEHVPEAHLLPIESACPICGDLAPRQPILRLQDNPAVDMVRCATCEGLSATRFPDDEYLARIYDPSHYSSDLLSSGGATLRCGRHIASFLDFPKGQDIKIIDYGGSDGGLTRAVQAELRRSGHTGAIDATIVDFERREDPDDLKFVFIEDFADLDEQFDVVIASAVLEHLTEFRSTVDKLLSLAKPGALFYARTPYDSPLQQLFERLNPGNGQAGYRVRWPRHVHDFGPAFWDRFLDTLDYRGHCLHSAPSIVESEFAQRPLRTLAAYVLKAPSHLETQWVRPKVGYGRYLWHLVGGWEVVLRLEGPRKGPA